MEIINKMINKKGDAYPKIFISGIDERWTQMTN